MLGGQYMASFIAGGMDERKPVTHTASLHTTSAMGAQ